MRAVIQRVKEASVNIEGETVGQIGPGYTVLLGIRTTDTKADAEGLAEKIVHLRIMEDDDGKMNRSILDAGGAILSVSQFTLFGDTRKGRRPSFIDAAPPEQAEALYEVFNQKLRSLGVPVQTGHFRANMLVEIHNDGPVTLLLDTETA
jgi:D-tyrosyl-tRNA(Tyr) deacylase